MSADARPLRVLLVDDEADFRRAARTVLERRGITVLEAASGDEAVDRLQHRSPDLLVLDLKMPGRGGLEVLEEVRRTHPELPVVILTGHGGFDEAVTGLKLDIVDFVQKPVDLERFAVHLRELVERRGGPRPLREPTVAELMVAPTFYPRLTVDQSVKEAFSVLTELFFRPQEASLEAQGIRSALVFDRQERFVGQLRFTDVLRLTLPPSLVDSPYATFFTGMFLAQCKTVRDQPIGDVVRQSTTVDLGAPLAEAVHLMVKHRLVSLPVLDGGRLVGVLRDRSVVLELSRWMAV